MDISGTIIQILPEVGGVGKTGNNWRKQEFVIETKDQYPKKICFTAWGEKIDQFQLAAGEDVTVSFDAESREYNGRWYTELKAWNLRKGQASPIAPNTQEAPAFVGPPPMPPTDEDDLPF
jgi:hypothetical protein